MIIIYKTQIPQFVDWMKSKTFFALDLRYMIKLKDISANTLVKIDLIQGKTNIVSLYAIGHDVLQKWS